MQSPWQLRIIMDHGLWQGSEEGGHPSDKIRGPVCAGVAISLGGCHLISYFGVSHAYYFGKHNYDNRFADSNFGQGFGSRGGIYADRVDDDEYGTHTEIDNNTNWLCEKRY